MSPDDEAKLEKLTSRHDELAEACEDEPENETLATEYEEVSAAIDHLSEGEGAYALEDISRAGAVVMLDHQGGVRIERGLLRKEDRRKDKANATGLRDSVGGEAPHLGDALTRELSAVRTGIIAANLAGNPRIALVAVVHALALPLLYPGGFEVDTCLVLAPKETRAVEGVTNPTCTPAFASLESAHAAWRERLPVAPVGLWDWCMSATESDLMELLALCAALALDARVGVHEGGRNARHRAADMMADALAVDPLAWCGLSGLNLFERTTKAFTLDVVRREVSEVRATSYAPMKKTEMARRATIALDGKWLPDVLLRTALAPALLEDPATPVAVEEVAA